MPVVKRLAPLAPVALLFAHVALQGAWTAEQAITELCYARTLAEGGGLALQPDAIQSSGFESLPWVLLLALCHLAGLPLLASAKLLGVLLGGLALLVVPGVAARLEGRRQLRSLDLLPALLLAAHPAIARHAAGGTGVSLTLLLLALALRWMLDEERRFLDGHGRGLWVSSLPLALLVPSTPAGPALLLGPALGRLMSRGAARRVVLADLPWGLALLAAVAICALAGYLRFAVPIPGVLAARESLAETQLGGPLALHHGGAWLLGLLRGWGITVPLVLVALVGALRSTLYWARVSVAGLGLAAAGLTLASGGGTATETWTLPSLLALALLAASGFTWLLGPLASLLGTRRWRMAGTGAVGLGLLAGPLVAAAQGLVSPPPSPHDRDQAFAAWLEREVQELGWRAPQVAVLSARPGSLAWRRFRVVDASGVTDPAIRRYNGNRSPQELERLVLRDRQPDVLVEQAPWRHLHHLSERPEALRRFVRVASSTIPAARAAVSLSRRLLLEEDPWPDRQMRLPLSDDLVLVGARAIPGHLVLLWMSRRNAPAPRRARVGVASWSVELPVGPTVYPMPRWRAGEIVRQLVPLPPAAVQPPAGAWVELVDGPRQPLAGVDPRDTALPLDEWYRRRLLPLLDAGRWGEAEALASLWRDPELQIGPLVDHLRARVEQLTAQDQLQPAARHLHEARRIHSASPDLRRAARVLAERAYRRARAHIRLGRWPDAFESLRVAALADPTSAWIARRLEEARSRQPFGDHLSRILALELAQRGLALSPSPAALNRVLRAHLALGQAREAIVAWHRWRGQVEGDRRGRFLLARALTRQGQLREATILVEQVLGPRPPPTSSRRCPGWFPLEPYALANRLRGMLGLPPGQITRSDLPPIRLDEEVQLVAGCARWSGRAVKTTLYLTAPGDRELPLELAYGSRRQRLLVSAAPAGLRQVSASLLLPPATYPVQVRLLSRAAGAPVSLGTTAVGPEASFGFELPSYAPWTRRGEAFGAVPVLGRNAHRRFLAGYQGERYADSFLRGFDRLTGSLGSPPFRLRRSYLMLLVAGGDQPELGVDLFVDGQRRRTVRGDGREVMRAVFLPVAELRGRFARVVIRDNSSRRWGHLAVDEIRQVDGPIPGIAPGD